MGCSAQQLWWQSPVLVNSKLEGGAAGWCRKTGVTELLSLGGFRNIRKDFDWEGAKLELDETQFEWGTVYEIEVETVRLS